ncbi:MAG: hypothetical protein KGD59_07230 [Candidatus Heimdallarchaeota archaeon]|nr:hypothetical protein [Candidatus Heimdallarchaeota archaeon]MBY8994326.1 hypothetical protein [Candidatus Heimdallarchaeota archaeon]
MKKIMKLGIPILLALIMLAPTMVKANYNVAVGNSFTFDVVKSSWDVTVAGDSASVKGFEFEEMNYAEKTQITVLVTAASAISVDWDMTVGSVTYSGGNGGLDLLGMIFYMFYPILLADLASGTWNQTEMDLGPSIFPMFFVDPDVFSDFFYDFANETYITSAFSDPEWVLTNIGGSFDNSSDIAVFDWQFDMTWTDAVSGHNYGGTYSMVFAFDKTTGATKGYYFDVDYAGQVDFTAISVKHTQRVEQVGYNLPGVGFIPGFEWFMVIPALALLAGLPIIIKRRK